jgi:hypothetical protein
MARHLLVFVGSPGVGSYVNAMANAVSKYDIDRIVLVNVVESPSGQQVNFEDFANKILWDVLCGLLDGVYREPKRDGSGYREVPVPEAKNCDAYEKLKQIFGSAHELNKVKYPFLTPDIEKLKRVYGPDIIVDLSGVPKRVAIDVLTACLAAGISDVMLFELERPMGGQQALYHNLTERDYKHVVLPRWEPLINNIKFFSARQNRKQLRKVVISILASLVLVIGYQLVRVGLGEGSWLSWLFIVAIAIIGLVGGVTPILDAWGGIGLILNESRKKKIRLH